MSSTRRFYQNVKVAGTTIFVFITALFLAHYLYRYTRNKNSKKIDNLIRKENLEKYTLTLFDSIKEEFVNDVLLKVEKKLVHSREKRHKYLFINYLDSGNGKFDLDQIMPIDNISPDLQALSKATGTNIRTSAFNGINRSNLPCVCPNITAMNLKLGVLRGKRGLTGVKGEKGKKGSIGWPAGPGIKGKKGIQGYRGLSGTVGESGEIGEPGPIGALGEDVGRSGTPGYPGDPGYAGLPGASGLPGKPGRQGPPGAKGARGDTGFAEH